MSESGACMQVGNSLGLKKTWTTNLSPAILNILLNIYFSLRHIIVHALSLLVLWYWCNILIHSLSFKYVCHKEFDPKSAAASWNTTSSCLLPSQLATHVVNCACVLHHFIREQWWRSLHRLLELLLKIKGPRDLNYVQSQ